MKVKYYAKLAKMAKKKEERIEAKNVKKLLSEIEKKYGKDAYKIAKTSHILINDETCASMGGFKAKLTSNDIVRFLPVCGGG